MHLQVVDTVFVLLSNGVVYWIILILEMLPLAIKKILSFEYILYQMLDCYNNCIHHKLYGRRRLNQFLLISWDGRSIKHCPTNY